MTPPIIILRLMANFLDDGQLDAIERLRTGSILCGGVGSGKSRTALAYYYKQQGGSIDPFIPMDQMTAKDLYIITTARKRDTLEWEKETAPFLLNKEDAMNRYYICNYYVDSWTNIKKYKDVKDAFFIFDEQRVVGYGVWTKAFLKIAKHNDWILLSATPGDTWMDYLPVFLANGFYENKTDFIMQHVIQKSYVSYFQVDYYINISKLRALKEKILINIDYQSPAHENYKDVITEYDKDKYRFVCRKRWNIFEERPIETASEFCSVLRKITNTDHSRINAVLSTYKEHPKIIIFYNFDYELDLLKQTFDKEGIIYREWNGHKHESLPEDESWVYLVQYAAGSEGWNCTKTDSIIFYSMNYSYKQMVQAAGRINRRNTPYKELYFYVMKTKAPIDNSIALALKNKKDFNIKKFAG